MFAWQFFHRTRFPLVPSEKVVFSTIVLPILASHTNLNSFLESWNPTRKVSEDIYGWCCKNQLGLVVNLEAIETSSCTVHHGECVATKANRYHRTSLTSRKLHVISSLYFKFKVSLPCLVLIQWALNMNVVEQYGGPRRIHFSCFDAQIRYVY